MPDAFKGHYRIDENGDIKMLKSLGESKAIMNRFWEEERSKLKIILLKRIKISKMI
ncbi:hypothetical protein [Chryseobacterium sediminis]|uniref:hypothetical protein n=1 Tax=Chryseobacterium sediminis TaxID=1679494 RepID=UPI00142F2638|nr:hypothetical protein [Chryseobacterium sediminis]